MRIHQHVLLLACLLTACRNDGSTKEVGSSEIVDITSESSCAKYLTGRAFSSGERRIEFPAADQVVITDLHTGAVTAQCHVSYSMYAELNEQYGGLSRLVEMKGCADSGIERILLRDKGDLFDNNTNTAYAPDGVATAKAGPQSGSNDHTVLDATSATACENYLKGKTFTGGSARLEFGYDGTVSAYGESGNLVFAGTLEVGDGISQVSRWIFLRDMSGGGKLKYLLSNDGKLMEQSSMVIYKPS